VGVKRHFLWRRISANSVAFKVTYDVTVSQSEKLM